MARLEIARLILFAIEWLLSAACLGVIPNQLYRIATSNDDSSKQVHVCAIGGSWFCRFAIVWTVIAFLLITVCIAWHLAEYCSKFALPPLLEMMLVALLAVWWLIAAIGASLAKINTSIVDVTAGARKFFRGGSWILTALFIVSTVIAWCAARDEDTARQDQFIHQAQNHQPEDFPAYV